MTAPVRSGWFVAVQVTVPVTEIAPAEYETALAGIVGPLVGVNAVEIAATIQPALEAARLSVTVTEPKSASRLVPIALDWIEPISAEAGALIDKEPPVMVRVTPVPLASAGPIGERTIGARTIAVISTRLFNLWFFILSSSLLIGSQNK